MAVRRSFSRTNKSLRVQVRFGETENWTLTVSLSVDLSVTNGSAFGAKVRRLVSAGRSGCERPVRRHDRGAAPVGRTSSVLVEENERRDRADRPLLVTQLALGRANFPRTGEAAQVLGATERPEGAPCAARRKRPLAGRPGSRAAGSDRGLVGPTCLRCGAPHRGGWCA